MFSTRPLRHPALIVALALTLALAGCIRVPTDDAVTVAATAPPRDRIVGMTSSETVEDSMVGCNSGTLDLAPRACAQRVLVAEGRIGVARLPVELIGSNGEITIRPSEGDTWRFTATIRVSALTPDAARRGLDTAWAWTHEKNGVHVMEARPTPTASIDTLGARVQAIEYELELPTWLVLDVHARSDNGGIRVSGFTMGSIDVETDNGAIVLSGEAQDLRARTDNGEVVATLRPLGGGTFDLAADNGQLLLDVPEGRNFGYDVTARTDNGRVSILLRDGVLQQTDDGATFRTDRFDARNIQTTILAQTDNGQVIIGR